MRRKGITLIEIIVSIALFAIIASAMITVFMSATSLNKKSFEYKKSELAMRQVVESKQTSGQVTIDGRVFQIEEVNQTDSNLHYVITNDLMLPGKYYRVKDVENDLYYDYFIGQ